MTSPRVNCPLLLDALPFSAKRDLTCCLVTMLKQNAPGLYQSGSYHWFLVLQMQRLADVAQSRLLAKIRLERTEVWRARKSAVAMKHLGIKALMRSQLIKGIKQHEHQPPLAMATARS